jgi:crossover junction endodeoxyribonuclease RuvC
MRVLGVDPGSAITGWGLLEGPAPSPRLVESGVIRLGGSGVEFAEKLHRLSLSLTDLVVRLGPTAAAVEAPFHGVNARSALQLAHARGVVLATLAGAGVPVAEYAPATVKQAVAGNGRAGKDQVQAMVVRLLGVDALPGPSDRADALAVALCHVHSAAFSRAIARQGRDDGRGRREPGRG